MDNTVKIKANVRLLIFIVSLPFWALLFLQIYSLWLGDPYSFDFTHIFIVAAAYLFFRTVVMGKHPVSPTQPPKQ